MASYTSTQRFVKITDYLLLEYNYTTAPTPEIYYVNTGFPAVGFEKIVNYLDIADVKNIGFPVGNKYRIYANKTKTLI